jgi:septum formation protein
MIILASASPRRHDLLSAAGIEHVVRPTSIREVLTPGEMHSELVCRLAEEKATACPRTAGDLVIGADTLVAADNEVLGKPADESDARRMLRLLSGRTHLVYTGICLLRAENKIVDFAVTEVELQHLSDSEISEYTQSGEPFDKAGAYAIQGLASKFVVSIRGSYSNVVGLPISLVYRYLKDLSV